MAGKQVDRRIGRRQMHWMDGKIEVEIGTSTDS